MTLTGSAAHREPAASVDGRVEARPSFAELYETYFSFAWRSARRLGTPQASIDDVVQEIFVVIHRRLPSFEARSSVKTWVFGIVLNVVRSHRRRLREKHPYALQASSGPDPESLSDRSPGPHECATRAEAARLVERLLDALDEDKREVFALAELEQMSAPEIAGALELPVNTVYSRLRLARQEFAAAAARYRARDGWRMR
jgi:RNA polymerase sigma-70 factor (ECF subfamily)